MFYTENLYEVVNLKVIKDDDLDGNFFENSGFIRDSAHSVSVAVNLLVGAMASLVSAAAADLKPTNSFTLDKLAVVASNLSSL